MSNNQWHKKESPLQGMSGLWGGTQGALTSSVGGTPGTTFGILLYGAGGGAGAGNYMGAGGCGGYTKLTISLPAGTYYATAGESGLHGTVSGYNQTRVGGGGKRLVGTDQGGTGGGFSGIWANNTYSGDPVCMVGGGGGSDWEDQGGNGGGCGINGGTGFDRIGNEEYTPNARPIGATLTAGGFYDWTYSSQPGPEQCNGEVGVQLRGGNATCTDTWAGGGGGGGYWGGGAGTGNVGQGGTPGSGGSGFVDDDYTHTIVTNTTSAQRLETFAGPDANNIYYQPNHPGTYGGGAARNGNGGGGRVRIYDETFTTLLHDFTAGSQNSSFTVTG